MIPETEKIKDILGAFQPVGLDDTGRLSLLNRIDTKFLLPVSLVPDLLFRMDGQFRVLEINERRIMNYTTTYYDTEDFLFFTQHVTGKPGRLKIRFRKYESTGVTYLEVKKKKSNSRSVKWRIENSPGHNGFDDQAIEFIRRHLPFDHFNLKQVLTGTFQRITLAGIRNNERITIDFYLRFEGTSGSKPEFPWLAVAEWKRDHIRNDSLFHEIVRKLSLRPAGFSKYCIGSASVYDLPKRNLLKPKFLLLNKIENEYYSSLCT